MLPNIINDHNIRIETNITYGNTYLAKYSLVNPTKEDLTINFK